MEDKQMFDSDTTRSVAFKTVRYVHTAIDWCTYRRRQFEIVTEPNGWRITIAVVDGDPQNFPEAFCETA
jgi:hypothetical protein